MFENAVTGPANRATREIRLEPSAQVAQDARRFVAEVLSELGHSGLVDDAKLIASELVTNSRAAAPDCPIWLSIWQTGAFLDLEVWDCSPEPPVHLDPDLLAEGGRGIHIVKELGSSFGYTILARGKVVWVILAREETVARGISWV